MKTAGCLPQTRIHYALILGCLSALGPLYTDLYLPALPQITHDFLTTSSATQLSLTATLIGLGLGQLIFGPLSDRLGRRPPLLISLLILVVASWTCYFAVNVEQLILARFIQGVMGSGGVVISRAIARDKYQSSALTQFFALLMMINGIAPIIAPVVGGILLTWLNWRDIFMVLGIASSLLLIFSHFQISETLPKPLRHKGSFISVFGQLGNLVLQRRFIGLCLTQGFILAGMFAYIGASSFVLQEHYHLSAQLYSLCFAANGLGLIIAAQISARLAKRWGELVVLKGVLILAITSAALLVVIGFIDASLWLLLPILFITISVNSMIGTTGTMLAMQEVPAQSGGSASALLGACMFVLGGISAPLSGLGGSSTAAMAITIFGCYAIAFIIFTCLIGWREPIPPVDECIKQ
ncbi:multidrug effflux MFS transporter [Celerinatantimonas yamalensis]|uniref:Bcr/CflA family efflux transporter n=1 Tax=Celerinatantimonas yamalensis TaxID=559956 RepID=A0ABW9G2J9_9GAMM